MAPWVRRKEVRATEILDAALKVFVDRGYHATRLEDVGAAAGVTKGTIYLYFRNKESLFTQVVQSTIEPFLTEAEETLAGHAGSAAELLDGLSKQYWEKLGRDKMALISRLMQVEGANFPELSNFYVEKVLYRGRRLVTQILQYGVARGEFHPVDPLCFSEALFAIIELASTQAYGFRSHDPARADSTALVHVGVELLVRGVLVDPAAWRPRSLPAGD